MVFIGQTSENRSTQEKDINISFHAARKNKNIYIKYQKKKRYRYILPCQVYFCPTVQSCRVKHCNISVLFFNLKTRFTEKCSAINIYTLKKRFLQITAIYNFQFHVRRRYLRNAPAKILDFHFFLQVTNGDKSVFSCSAQANVAIHLLLTTAAARCITLKGGGGVGWVGLGWGAGRWNVNESKNQHLMFEIISGYMEKWRQLSF